ncbi:MAG: hypothetical protein M0Z65_00960 [Firmicutes bacterium]|nr:hypothetical protein [Bacillota bacterium]
MTRHSRPNAVVMPRPNRAGVAQRRARGFQGAGPLTAGGTWVSKGR